MNTALALLVDVLLKSTLLLALAGLASPLLRRASAAARHLHWQLTLAGLLALPLLAPLLPSLHVTLPAPLTAAAPWLTAHPLDAADARGPATPPRSVPAGPSLLHARNAELKAKLSASGDWVVKIKKSPVLAGPTHAASADPATSGSAVVRGDRSTATADATTAAVTSAVDVPSADAADARVGAGRADAVRADTRRAETGRAAAPGRGTPGGPSARSATMSPVQRLTLGVLLVWALGAAVVLVTLAVGLLRVRATARAARPLQDADWQALVDRIRHELGLRRRVRLLVADGPVVPMTWGLRAPVVLLPADARDWSTPRRRHVLLHELAHVQRFDWATQLLAQLACALYWFQPLAWAACRALRRERERACDDSVLLAGGKASEYAEHLLQIATTRGAGFTGSFAALAMARRSQLEGRLLAVLDHQRDRRRVAARRTALAALLAAVVVVPLACIRPQAEPSAAPPAGAPAAGAPAAGAPAGGTVAAQPGQPSVQPAPRSPQSPPAPQLAPAARPTPMPGAPAVAPPPGRTGPTLRVQAAPGRAAPEALDPETIEDLLAESDASQRYSDIPPTLTQEQLQDLASLGYVLDEPTPEPLQDLDSLGYVQGDEWEQEPCQLAQQHHINISFECGGDEHSRWAWTTPDGEYTVEATDLWITPTADDKGIADMAGDGLLTIEVSGGTHPARIEVRGEDGEVRLSGRVGDHDGTADELRAALATHLPAVLRQTGLGAEARVERIIEREGIPGVLAEIGRLNGDSARLQYSQLLVGEHDLTIEDRIQLLDVAASNLESDWAVNELLRSNSSIWLEDPRLIEPLVAALGSLDSDAYAAESIGSLLDEAGEKPDATAALLGAAASGIESDAYLAEVLGRVCGEQLKTPAVAAAWLEGARSIESDAYKAELLGPFLSCEEIGDDVRATALKAAADIESDAYMAEVLNGVPEESLANADVRAAFLAAASAIGSDSYLAEVLGNRLPETTDAALAIALLGSAAAGIESDAYMAEVLQATPSSLLAQQEVKAAFLKAADTIQSRAYQDEVRGLLGNDGLKDA